MKKNVLFQNNIAIVDYSATKNINKSLYHNNLKVIKDNNIEQYNLNTIRHINFFYL